MPLWLTWRLVRRVVLGAIVVLVAYYAVTVFRVWQASRDDDRRASQAIIVLGAAQYDGRPSEVFKARLDHAATLYREGVAPLVVVTGGKQPGDRFTEATAGANYLHGRGVPDDAIRRETTSRNSWESLAASARFLRAEGIHRVVLVSDPFHALRIREIAGELGFDAVTSPTRTSPISGISEWLRFATEAVRVAIGQVFGFGRLARTAALRSLAPGLAILARPSGVV